MAQAAVAAGRPGARKAPVWTDRRRRTAELRRRYMFAGEVLDFYGALLGVQQHAYEEALSARPPARDLVAYVAEIVVPAVVDVSIAAGPPKLRDAVALRVEGTDPRDLVAAWIRGEDQVMVDRYLARASLSPVLEAVGPEYGAVCAGPRDPRHCPQCGGLPQLSFVAPAGEDLATGRRYLSCARCSASWGYARMTCAGCGEDSTSRLTIFNEVGTTSGERGSVVRGLQGRLPENQNPHGEEAVFPHIRIEACDSCRHYLLNIDLASDPAAVPVVDELAALPLGLHASEQGFSKITPNLMGF